MSIEYVDPEGVPAELQCAVCISPFTQPHCLPCGHTFCLKCVSRLKKESGVTCPVCKEGTLWECVRKSDRALSHLVDSLLVLCPNTDCGCDATIKREDVEAHLQKHCQYTVMACTEEGCDKQVYRKDFEGHVAACKEEPKKQLDVQELKTLIEQLSTVVKTQQQRLDDQAKEIERLKTTPSPVGVPLQGALPDTVAASATEHSTGTLVEFQWFIQSLKKPRGSLISPNFTFADLEWQLSIDGSDNGIYLAANGRGVTASYMISVVEGDLKQTKTRNWVSVGCREFGETKWGCQGIMYCYYEKSIVVTAAFTHIISPINIVSQGNSWVVGVDSHYGTASKKSG